MGLWLEKEMQNHTWNDKGTKLNQNEILIQTRDSLHRNAWEGKPNASHVNFGCEFLIYARVQKGINYILGKPLIKRDCVT